LGSYVSKCCKTRPRQGLNAMPLILSNFKKTKKDKI
jgi:hypothetical protein